MESIRTTLSVSKETRDKLASIGKKNQSFDDLINQLLEICHD